MKFRPARESSARSYGFLTQNSSKVFSLSKYRLTARNGINQGVVPSYAQRQGKRALFVFCINDVLHS